MNLKNCQSKNSRVTTTGNHGIMAYFSLETKFKTRMKSWGNTSCESKNVFSENKSKQEQGQPKMTRKKIVLLPQRTLEISLLSQYHRTSRNKPKFQFPVPREWIIHVHYRSRLKKPESFRLPYWHSPICPKKAQRQARICSKNFAKVKHASGFRFRRPCRPPRKRGAEFPVSFCKETDTSRPFDSEYAHMREVV